MGIFDALDISGSALSAERLRMDVTSENLANAQTTRGANGQPYRRKEVVLQEVGDNSSFGATLAGVMGTNSPEEAPGGVTVAGITEDKSQGQLVYDPGHPDANAQGYVRMPNVEPVEEMTDLITESRSYEANITAMSTAKSMYTKTLDILR
ncbi:MAG TPA: flagellar basal body rod protein FlgC [Thermoleophilaceae bacterium]|jgi:flagellar basal-body rod protein FlgC